MKKEIVILSDLYGRADADWLKLFKQAISNEYTITFHDACELANIDSSKLEKEEIHKQFIDSGIENAVGKLIDLEKDPKIYIGCSIGGVIAWQAGMLGLNIQKLITISSTRLRKETEKPKCPIKMYFGELDEFKPDLEWLEKMDCSYKIIKDGTHNIYKDEVVVAEIMKQISIEQKE